MYRQENCKKNEKSNFDKYFGLQLLYLNNSGYGMFFEYLI